MIKARTAACCGERTTPHVTLVALICPESFGTNVPVALRTAGLLLIDPNDAVYPRAYDSSLLLTKVEH
jgi:hypothetical protein